MNIALISSWICPLSRIGIGRGGGMSIYIREMTRSLGVKGASVDIFTGSHGKANILKISNNIRIIHLKHSRVHPALFTENLSNFIKKNPRKYDIVYSHYFTSGLVGLEIKRAHNLPLIQTFHTLAKIKEQYAGIPDEKRAQFEKSIIDNADKIIVSTEQEKKDVIRFYEGNKHSIVVIAPGVDHRVFMKRDKQKARTKLQLPEDRKLILFIGRIDEIKGINILCSAIKELNKKFSGFSTMARTIIIGGDEKKGKREDSGIQMVGSKSHSELRYYYNAADLIVVPSYHETFGLVALEAMSSQSAVIGSDTGGIKTLITDKVNGRLFPKGNATALAAVIWELLNDEKERERLGRNALLKSYFYDWADSADAVLKIAQSLKK